MGLPAAKLPLTKEKAVPREQRIIRTPGGSPTSRPLNGLLPEAAFLRTLCLERKRAERSRKLFVLMLLEPGTRNQDGQGINGKALPAVLSSIRETDIAGWYSGDSVLGVIFAELGEAPKEAVLCALRAKITSVLRRALTAEQADQVQLSFFCFPEDWGERGVEPGKISSLYPDLLQQEEAKKFARIVKRTMDIAGSAVALVFLSPVFLVIALAIRLTSPGPILFRQKRIGRYGKAFTFLKFRSMYTANDPKIHVEYVKWFIKGMARSAASEGKNGSIYKITKDPRVTSVGRFLRKTSLDELPQFFNVLKGEMSLVGPRPPIAYEWEAYDVWHRRRLLEAKPGITGLWQVNGRSRLRFDEMVRLDLQYAQGWSIWLDIQLLLRTPKAVWYGEGAY
jgi:lipopolysaccharide/colanic/teichoic acid biosynthesis glycosyltransferase